MLEKNLKNQMVKMKSVLVVLIILSSISCSSKKVTYSFCDNLEMPEYDNFERGVYKDPRNGKEYNWIIVGETKWMIDNLSYKIDSGCYAFKGRNDKAEKTGYLYTKEGANRAIPNGWRLPTTDDFDKLLECLYFTNDKIDHQFYYYCIRDNDFGFNWSDKSGEYWSKTETFSQGLPFKRYYSYWAESSDNGSDFYFSYSNFWKQAHITSASSKENGYFVRCIQNL